MKYKCTLCGYIYDETVEGTKFEDLPDTWVCPLCGVGKDMFEKVEEQFYLNYVSQIALHIKQKISPMRFILLVIFFCCLYWNTCQK